MNTYYATKNQMTQAWDKAGNRLAVTILDAPTLTVTQLKTTESDMYQAVQVGFGQRKVKNITKSLKNHLKLDGKASLTYRFLKEIPTDQNHTLNDKITVTDILAVGDQVNVTASTKGRGFAGAMKRWGFAGGPRTHGQSDRARAVGSIGQGTDPGRVHKGKKMPGHYGNHTKTVKNLTVVNIDSKNNQIWLSGPVPGPRGAVVKITKVSSKDFKGLDARFVAEVDTESNDNKESQS